MRIWKKPIDLQEINKRSKHTALESLAIEITEVGDDFVQGRMPVDSRTKQPFGLLHGGSSVLLAETLGSLGAFFASEADCHAVGLDINANHIRAVTGGWVTGTAKPVHIGRSTHVWQIDIVNEAGQLVCASRITMAILSGAGR